MLIEASLLLVVLYTHAIQPMWDVICANVSEYTMFVVGCFCSQIIGYFLGCLPYIIVDVLKSPQTASYKIQKRQYPTNIQILQLCASMMYSFTTVILPMLVFGGFFIASIGITRDPPFPKWYVVLIQLIFFFLVEDYLNYWLHRWLHLPWLYKHIHSVHHTYNAPFSLTAAYAHPAEIIILAIPTFVGPLAVSPHLYTLMIWQLLRNFEAIDIHSGYELPYSLKSLIPAYAGTTYHDYHHFIHSGNFASVFTWCDRLYGTDLGYQIHKTRNKHLSSS